MRRWDLWQAHARTRRARAQCKEKNAKTQQIGPKHTHTHTHTHTHSPQWACDSDKCVVCVKGTTNRQRLISTVCVCVCVSGHRRSRPIRGWTPHGPPGRGWGAGFVFLKKCHKTTLLNWCPIKLAFARALDFLWLCVRCWPYSLSVISLVLLQKGQKWRGNWYFWSISWLSLPREHQSRFILMSLIRCGCCIVNCATYGDIQEFIISTLTSTIWFYFRLYFTLS